jgi:hypothetical protein
MKKDKNPLAAVLVIVTGLIVIYFLKPHKGILIAAIVIGLLSLLVPFIAEKISFLWFKIADGLGWMTSRLILGIVFYLLLTPVSFLKRIFGKSDIRFKANGSTFFKDCNRTYTFDDFTKPW